MITCVLSSGSKGNSTFIATSSSKILIDIGRTSLYIEKKLKEINVDPNEINAILITHTHVDHISGLRVFIKKYNPIVYLTQNMYDELSSQFSINNYHIIDGDFKFNDLDIKVLKTSHDAPDSNGYIVENDNKSVVYITDTGYINYKYKNSLFNKDVYIIESNHDIDMLMNGSYPYNIKQRILGDRGHLSNVQCSKYLSEFIGNNTKFIILAHLSEENNTYQIAKDTLINKLEDENKMIDNIFIATQEDRTELITI